MPVTRSSKNAAAAKNAVDDLDIPAKRLRSRYNGAGLSGNDPIDVELLPNLSSPSVNADSNAELQIIPVDTAAPARRRAAPKARKAAAPKYKRKCKPVHKAAQDPCPESPSPETEAQPIVSAPVLKPPAPATCVICFDRPKCIVFAPCGHNLMCETCATTHYEGAELGGSKKSKSEPTTTDTKVEIRCPYCCQESDGWMKVFEV